MLKKSLVAGAIAVAALSAQAQTVILSETFDDISTLGAKGWVLTNLSAPVGGNSWFQGNAGIFAAQAGAAGSYIGADYLSGTDGGTVANFLISSTFSTAVAGSVSFYAKADIGAPYVDQIAYGFSSGSSSTTAFSLGSAITLGGGWTQYTASFAAQGAGSTGRFAIEYVGLGATANYIGIDTFAVTTQAVAAIPEPSTYALMALGIAGLACVRRRVKQA